MALGVLLQVATAVLAVVDPNHGPNATYWATALREHILDGYDTNVPPPGNSIRTIVLPDGTSVETATGCDVELQIRVLKFQKVDIADGHMSLKVWLRMQWTDSRLTWDPAEYGGLTYTHVNGGMPEDWEVWLPDIQPYNAISGTVNTLEPSMLKVSSVGVVYYTRPGTLEIQCKFTGLVAFPFDKPKCSFDMGGFMYSGFHQGISFSGIGQGTGYELEGKERVQGTSYQEYEIISMSSSLQVYMYRSVVAGASDEPFPIATYTMTLKRGTMWYQLYIFFPSILITCLSFTVFWAETSSADPLSFGITVIVVVMLQQLVLIGMLPVCSELLWIDLFYLANTGFCIVSLIESFIVIAIESNEEDHVLPQCIIDAGQTIIRKAGAWISGGSKVAPDAATIVRNTGSKGSLRNITATLRDAVTSDEQASSLRTLAASPNVTESIAGIIYRRMQADGVKKVKEQPPSLADRGDDTERLVFFERMFLELDEDRSGFVEKETVSSFLSFMALGMDPARRDDIFEAADMARDGALTRLEFCMVCRDYLWDVPISMLQIAMRNLKDSRDAIKTRNHIYWAATAKSIESWARVTIIPAYLTVLTVLFQIDFHDDYGLNDVHSGMLEGPAHARWRGGAGQAIGIILLVVFSIAALVAVNHWSVKIDAKRSETEKEAETQAVRSILIAAAGAKDGTVVPASRGEMSPKGLSNSEMKVETVQAF
mmetsp:Transcript_17534/g.44969  ORF Transcript_17534/g.44969 Transcript_17534/m.44969 type:complete len:711 (-) Transcript_17534:131-2263(-)|eukprot:CAMPEP_0115858968 /NCGR_PEP_ID=MMETSP0287-20121206/16370_1 /TAXON_ID=412157 /ORGANISM="Chrysochromulina rotalis, Strain UIO044" /LENGTH=710 /DNA_ID=CAMNT_0003313247 /DNA_START=29 /DNA_END=2161 /DNA_ORIENTATION=-